MYWLINTLLSVGLIVTLVACRNGESRNRVTMYFNVDSLVTAQSMLLRGQSATLTKVEMINGVEEKSEINAKDSIDWETELEMFRQLDLNRPSFVNQYDVSEGGSGDVRETFTAYQRKEREPVVWLRIYYDSTDRIATIEGEYLEENALYYNERRLRLTLDQAKSQPVLHSYSIVGKQRMLFSDTVRYRVEASINIK